MSYRFTGDSPLVYPAYLDAGTSTTLVAVPGGIYGIYPAGSRDIPVPPPDGRWEAVPPPPGTAVAPATAAVPSAPAAVTAASTGIQDEGK